MITFVLIFATLALIYFYIYEWKFKYWERHGIPSAKPHFPFGTMPLRGKKHLSEYILKEYDQFKNKTPFYGGYRLLEPVLYITDRTLVKNIMIKDFSSFHSRGLYENRRDDPMASHLFVLSGQQWKRIREKVSPVFTSGKIRFMTPTILNVANQLSDAIAEEIKIDPVVDMKEWLARFTTDVIGTTAFGLECNSIKNPEAVFRKMGRDLLEDFNFVKIFFGQNFPRFSRAMHMTILPDYIRNFFFNTVKQNVEYRVKNNIKKNDFVDLLLTLYNKDKTNDEKDWDMEGLSVYEIAAQCFVFFFAGFETVSNAVSYTLLEFSRNNQIQNKAREHVKEVLKKHNNNITYDMLQDLTFIDQCIFETLRMHPLAPFLFRIANENYPLPNTNYTISKGESILIPIYAFQMDPDFFPNPLTYDPERFATKESQQMDIFMPFGEGQRICIGERFAKMETKLALVVLLLNFEFDTSAKTKYPPALNTKLPLMSLKDSIDLKLKKI